MPAVHGSRECLHAQLIITTHTLYALSSTCRGFWRINFVIALQCARRKWWREGKTRNARAPKNILTRLSVAINWILAKFLILSRHAGPTTMGSLKQCETSRRGILRAQASPDLGCRSLWFLCHKTTDLQISKKTNLAGLEIYAIPLFRI
jgi:hypothetical protein